MRQECDSLAASVHRITAANAASEMPLESGPIAAIKAARDICLHKLSELLATLISHRPSIPGFQNDRIVIERRTQLLQAQARALFYRTQRALQRSRDLRLTHPHVIGENEHTLLLCRKLSQGLRDGLRPLMHPDRSLDIDSGVWYLRQD